MPSDGTTYESQSGRRTQHETELFGAEPAFCKKSWQERRGKSERTEQCGVERDKPKECAALHGHGSAGFCRFIARTRARRLVPGDDTGFLRGVSDCRQVAALVIRIREPRLGRCNQIRQLLARVEHARLHSGLGDADDIGDLFDRFAVEVDQIDDLAVLRR
jgi:hypothetical protein